jgi:PAS domain S-box-containing protein
VWNESTRFLFIAATGLLVAGAGTFARRLGDLVEKRTAELRSEAEHHKTTAGTLAEVVERFEQVVNNITEVFWLSDVPKKQILYISPAYERVWGHKCDELYRNPKSWAETVHPDDREEIIQRSLTDQARDDYDVEYRIIRPDGAVRWIRDRAFPVRNQQGEIYRIVGLAEDITERRRTQQVVQTQAAILENMAEGVVVTNERGLIVQMNPAAEKIWGYKCSEVLGKPASVFSALPEPEAMAVMREVLATLQVDGIWRGIFKNRRKDGAIISCEALISRVEIQGRVLMVAVEQDITERERAEEALRQSEEALRAFLNAVPEPAMLLDGNGAVIVANRTLAQNLDVAENELVRKPVFDFLPPLVAARRKAVFDHVIANGKAVQFEDSRGDRVFINWFSPVTDSAGEVSRVAVFGFDVTERKRAEAVLRESEQTYRALVETTGTAYLILDMQGRVLDANAEYAFVSVDMEGRITESNRAYQALLGCTAEELNLLTYFDVTPEKWHASEARLVAEQVLARGYSDVYEKEYRRKDGTVFPVELRAFLLRGGGGQPAGMWAIVRDITERKRAAAELKEAHNKLEQRVRVRTAELEAVNAPLSQSEKRYRSLVNNLNVGVYRNEPGLDGGFVHANPALARMHGFDSVEEFQKVRVANDQALPYIQTPTALIQMTLLMANICHRSCSCLGRLWVLEWVGHRKRGGLWRTAGWLACRWRIKFPSGKG